MEHVIEVKGLYYRYPRGKEYVLRDINFTVDKGEFLAVTGENGAGKTTLSLILAGIIPNSQGGKMLGDVIVNGLNTKEHKLSELSQNVGVVLEDPESQLFTTKVINEICFGAENLKMDPEKIKERAKWAMEVVTLTGYDDRRPTMLSGGQKQRVAIAAALTMGPDIMVLDEPTSQLDPVGTGEVFQVIQMLKETYGMTIVMITHNSEEIARFADRVLVLNKGEVLAQGTPREIFGDIETLKKAWVSAPQSSMVSLTMAAEGEAMTEELPITLDEGIEYLNKHFAKVVVK